MCAKRLVSADKDGSRNETSVPFCDLARTQPIAELKEVAAKIITAGRFVGGDAVEEFEARFAAYCEARYCVGVSSGTSALEAALAALAIGEGDEVITVSSTFLATAAAIVNSGATPVFVDIDPSRRTMDTTAVESAMTPRTRAIVPVDLYGQPADLAPLMAIAHAHGIAVVEDAAQAHGARYQGQRIGSVADITCFSFYPSKNLGALGDAGAITTNSQDVAGYVRKLRNHGRSGDTAIVGRNLRLDAMQAAFLCVKLTYLDGWTAERRRIAGWYTEALADLPMVVPREISDSVHAYHLYVVQSTRRDEMRDYLARRGVETRIHYPYALHDLRAFSQSGRRAGDHLPHAEDLASQCISLPMFPGLTRFEVNSVVEAVNDANRRME
jgi:dTDP-4-amino-4,6-dideoxygalactose transaminase